MKIPLNFNNFVDPWSEKDFNARLSFLSRGLKNKKKLVYIFFQPDYGTFRYRVYNMQQVLNDTSDYSATYFFNHELELLTNYIENMDLIILARMPWSLELDGFMNIAFRHNKKIGYDIDDLIYDTNRLPQLINYLDIKKHDIDFWFGLVGKTFLAMKFADFFVCTNDFLAELIKVDMGKPCYVIPNFINYEQKRESFKILLYKMNKGVIDQELIIGYFSGSGTHKNDFETIVDDIEVILQNYPFVKLRIVGHLEIPKKLFPFLSGNRIEQFPLQNFLNLQVKIAECDINLIPLVLNEFTQCKSELKYFEAALVGSVSIAAPTNVFLNAIVDGVNGLLAYPGQWRDKICTYIENRQYSQVSIHNMLNHAVTEYYGQKIKHKITSVYDAIL